MKSILYTIFLLVALVLVVVWVANSISSTEVLPVNEQVTNQEVVNEVDEEDVVIEAEDDNPVLDLNSLQNDLEEINLGDVGELPL